MKTLYKQITDYLTAQHEEMVSLLKQLVNIESGPDQPEGVDAIIEIFKQEFDQLGLVSRTVEMEYAGSTIVSIYTPEDVENDAPIVLSGHMDTVFQPGVLSEHGFRITDW